MTDPKKPSIIEQNLVFPDAPDFISEPPKFTATEMIQMCEPMLPFWNAIRYSRPDPVIVADDFIL